MKFRTEYIAEKSSLTLNPLRPIVLTGSCFSQNIAAKMTSCFWAAFNPFSTLFNPFSIFEAIEVAIDGESGVAKFENSLFQHNGLWNSYMFGSAFSSIDREDCIEEFKLRQKEFIDNINNGKVLIITFGTSICYFLTDTSKVVGNCHKLPSESFYTRRLKVNEIEEEWRKVHKKLLNLLPELKVIFTVSPVRHLKNGFVGNERSKAILQLAVEGICAENGNCFYFPAYEIMLDDLRDYRFYASDLVHPSEIAIDYIWEKFTETFLDKEGLEILSEGRRKYLASSHRPKTGALGKQLK